MVLSEEVWKENSSDDYSYIAGAGITVPDDKTVYLAGEIRTDILAHETVHVLHDSSSVDELLEVYEGLLERLGSDKEAAEILEKLMKIYTTTYNRPHLDFIKNSKDVSPAERDKKLRAYGAGETLALLLGMLTGEGTGTSGGG